VFPLPDGPTIATNSSRAISRSTFASTVNVRPALRYVWPSRFATMITYPFLLALGHLAGACDAGDTPGGGATVEAAGAGSANAADAAAEAPASTTPGAASPAGAAPLPGSAAPARAGATATAEAPRTILFVGTSLTAGYGVGEDRAYPALLQEKIDAAGLPYRVVNAGVSGETSAGGLSRIDWLLENPVDVFVLELGANDGLRGLDIEAMRRNL